MRSRYKNTFKDKVLEAIQELDSPVVLRSDLNTLGEPRQISRALKTLVEDAKLIKFGYGIYIKAEKTPYSDTPIMVIPMAQACAEVFKRLGIRWKLGQAIQDWQISASTKSVYCPPKGSISRSAK